MRDSNFKLLWEHHEQLLDAFGKNPASFFEYALVYFLPQQCYFNDKLLIL